MTPRICKKCTTTISPHKWLCSNCEREMIYAHEAKLRKEKKDE